MSKQEKPIKDLTDEEIIGKLRGLDPSGADFNASEKRFAEELYRRYYKQAVNLSRYYGLSRDDAEDTAQESFIKLYRHIHSFNPNMKFKPWFFKLVMNKVKDLYRAMKKKGKTDDLDGVEETAEAEGGVPQENIVELVQNQELMGSIIECLPSKYKKVIILRIYGEMSFEDIAPLVGVGSRQVRKRLNKALGMVKACLKEKKWVL